MNRYNRILLTFTLLLFSNLSFAQKKNALNQEIKIMIKNFYTQYIIENDKANEDLKKIDALKMKYCTKAFLEKINKEEVEEDPFINGQDYSKEWIKSINIAPILNKKNGYKVCFTVTYKNQLHCINVIVKMEHNSWKIDNIYW